MGSSKLISKANRPTSRLQPTAMRFIIVSLALTMLVGVDAGYQRKSSQGYCKHTNGQALTRCFKVLKNVCNLKEACEIECDAFDSCVGYHYYGNNRCLLFPSSQSFSTCPTGYEYQDNGGQYVMAETADDLEGKFFPKVTGLGCYGKY